MATLRAFQAFDMRTVVPATGTVTATSDMLRITSGTLRTTLTGDIDPVAGGVRGTVLAYSQTIAGSTVFTATGVERSAATVLDILLDHDNDRLLAYTLSGNDRILGSSAADYLIGFGGRDVMSGGAGDDDLFGGGDADTLDGGAGADFLAGGTDTDLMRGGPGNDTYLVADASDRVEEGVKAGADSILSYVSRILTANVERLVLIGTAAISGRGDGDADTIDGNEAANRIRGLAGNDNLDGDGGADTLDGGAGRDLLRGGTGDDVFRFVTAAEANGDRVRDFAPGDRLDLSAIDADTVHVGNQAFRYLGAAGFTGHAGELTFDGAILRADLDGDRIAEFALRLDGEPALKAADFML